MARKNKSVLEILVLYPWWVSASLSIVLYLVLKYFIPSMDFQQKGPADITYMFYKGMATVAPKIAPVAALLLLLTAALSAINSWRKRQPTLSALSSLKSPAPRKSLLNHKAKRFDSTNDKRANDRLASNSLITKIDGTYSIKSELAAFESYRTNHAQGAAIKFEKVKEKTDLSMETLKKIEWYSFELFCKIYYECIGYKVTKTKAGADGGIDLLLYMKDSAVPCALVQCKSRAHRDIGVNYVRELLGVMTSEKVDKGILITNSNFTEEALKFANAHHIEPVHVFKLWMMVNELDADKKAHLIDFLESSDFTTPTCPNCELKLVERIAKKGKNAGQRFWGCINYPRCSYRLPMNKSND